MPTMKTILFVEDDAVIVQAYRMGLERAGFRVEVAEDGLAAMKILLLLKPNLVLLDLMMPKFSGTDVLKYIRSTPALKSTPVIILSNASIADQLGAAGNPEWPRTGSAIGGKTTRTQGRPCSWP